MAVTGNLWTDTINVFQCCQISLETLHFKGNLLVGNHTHGFKTNIALALNTTWLLHCSNYLNTFNSGSLLLKIIVVYTPTSNYCFLVFIVIPPLVLNICLSCCWYRCVFELLTFNSLYKNYLTTKHFELSTIFFNIVCIPIKYSN